MYAKVFEQILDSSIAENYELRHFFEDMLKLSDKTGLVDMTPEAIHRRINLPLDKVRLFLTQLQEPDNRSRSSADDGRRIKLVDPHRDWGWQIVNYAHYRAIRTEEERREYNREAQRRSRARKKAKERDTGMDGTPASGAYKAAEAAEVRKFNSGMPSALD